MQETKSKYSFIYSLRFKFFSLFLVSLVIILSIWYQVDKIIKEKEVNKLIHQTHSILNSITPYFTMGDINTVESIINTFGYTIIKKVPANAKVLQTQKSAFLSSIIFKTTNHHGFSLQYFDEIIAMKRFDYNFWEINKVKIFLTLIIGILFILAFITSTFLNPLTELNKSIKSFSDGDLLLLNTNRKDEIGDLIRVFNLNANKIHKMMKSRELILRNIGHELRTPIAKMKFLLTLGIDSNNAYKLKTYVDSMQQISENMLEFERMHAPNLIIDKSKILAESLLFEVLNNYIDEKDYIKLNIINSPFIIGDARMLNIVFSNLISNAIKYSQTKYIEITLENTFLEVTNKGEKLAHEINYYLEPFYRDKNHYSIQGYGLGLSLVKEILSLHQMQLEYEYKEQTHSFKIIFC